MGKRILTVDDSKTMRDMLASALGGAGYEVIQAVDGQDGLDTLAEQTEPVDVIITDVNMPRMDGLTLVRHLRDMDAHRATPILILTTESSDQKKAEGRAAGATGWIVKPFQRDKLLGVLKRVCP